VRFHLTPVRVATIKNTNNKNWQDCRGKGTPIHYWWECKLEHHCGKTIWGLLRKLKIELSYGPAIPQIGISQRNASQVTIKKLAHPYS
jgi:hypothetical protein